MGATNVKIVLVVLGTLGAYTWFANAIPQLESEVPAELTFGADVSEAELVEAGQDLFEGAGQCVTCHGLGERAPNLLTDHAGEGAIGQRCAERVPGEDCKTYLYRSLTDPLAYLVEGFTPSMPPQGQILSRNQIWALVSYLQSVGGDVTVTASDLESGAAIAAAPASAAPADDATDPLAIMRGNLCFGCHTLDGEGVQLGPPLDGIGSRLGAEEIRRSILDPGAEASEGYEQLLGTMPPTFGQTLGEERIEALVSFLAGRR